MKKLIFKFCFALGICFNTKAEVKPNSLFSDNMVLQNGVVVPIWGKADENEKVKIEFCGQTVKTVAKDGKWFVKLNALKSGGPFEMKISGKNSVVIKNVLVGDVWICSGQSNMNRILGLVGDQKPIIGWREAVEDAKNYPQIRFISPARITPSQPIEDLNANWRVCDTSEVKKLSAVGYFFGREIAKEVKIPIGLIFVAKGGTPAESWTSRAAIENNPELKSIAMDYDKSITDYKLALEKYYLKKDSLLNKWNSDSLNAIQNNLSLPKKPMAPANPQSNFRVSFGLFNGMIAPLIPFAIKGVIWYQGEDNKLRAKQYQTVFPNMIADWRNRWNLGDFPFLYVQVAPYKDMNPEIRESQMLCLKKTKNTAMVVTVDCGDSSDIHPNNKRPVGERLALGALALAYGKKVAYSGPIYKSMEIKGNAIELSFDFINKGLMVKGEYLTDFVIAGADKNFVPAKAVIKGDKIVVSSENVSNPVAVRMGWKNVPHVNLFNKDGLPASPFRTDVE